VTKPLHLTVTVRCFFCGCCSLGGQFFQLFRFDLDLIAVSRLGQQSVKCAGSEYALESTEQVGRKGNVIPWLRVHCLKCVDDTFENSFGWKGERYCRAFLIQALQDFLVALAMNAVLNIYIFIQHDKCILPEFAGNRTGLDQADVDIGAFEFKPQGIAQSFKIFIEAISCW